MSEFRQTHGEAEPVAALARRAAQVAGVTGLLALAGVMVGETTLGEDFTGSPLAAAAGWLVFLSTGLLVLGITGLLVGPARAAGAGGRRAAWAMQLAAAAFSAASATLPLVVIGTHDRYPDLVNEPPVAIPATFILSGVALGAAGIALALALRRAGVVSSRVMTFLIAASVVAIVPLPAKHFLLAFAVAAVLAPRRGSTVSDGFAAVDLEQAPAR